MTTQDFVQQLLAHMGIDSAVVTLIDSDENLEVNISVDETESGLLIGRHAETLESLQHLVRLLYQKDIEKPISVNINDFRQKRTDYLSELANRVAERVIASGRPQTLRLPASERRIIHMVLADHEQVRTESEGEGTYRVLKVFPK